MKIRRVQAAAIGAVLIAGVGATQAGAATKAKPAKPVKQVCDEVSDVTGDATGFLEPGLLPSEPGLDIVSADIATNTTTLTAVVRVLKLSSTTLAPTGRTFYVNFTVGGTQLYIHGDSTPTSGITGGVGTIATTRTEMAGVVKVTYDNAKSEVRMSVPLAVFGKKSPIKKGTHITAINALSQREIDLVAVAITPTADETGNGDYVAGTPSCVKVGS